MKKLEKGKAYTEKQLWQMRDEYPEVKDFFENRVHVISTKQITKPIIKSFENFDNHTKNIYSSIAKAIRKLNKNQEDLYVIASGSRVNGKWRTDAEAESLAQQYNIKKPKYSDYDFISNAKYMPNLIELAKELNVKYINKIGSYNKNEEVNIPLL